MAHAAARRSDTLFPPRAAQERKQEKLDREKRRQQNEMKNTTYQTVRVLLPSFLPANVAPPFALDASAIESVYYRRCMFAVQSYLLRVAEASYLIITRMRTNCLR